MKMFSFLVANCAAWAFDFAAHERHVCIMRVTDVVRSGRADTMPYSKVTFAMKLPGWMGRVTGHPRVIEKQLVVVDHRQ